MPHHREGSHRECVGLVGGDESLQLRMVPLVLGGTVTAGAPLMSDANGAAIAATAAAASTRRIIGIATQPGVAGDIIDCWLSQSLLDRA